MTTSSLSELLGTCLDARISLFEARHETAFRLFNGFTEGCPDLVVDLYGGTAVVYNYADPPEGGRAAVDVAQQFLQTHLGWLRAGILKTRSSKLAEERRGTLLFGREPDRKMREGGIWYALNLTAHQDASLYLDTRNLRGWALDRLEGKSVLNTFAYTGSLGVAALAGGASRVVQLDRNRKFLNVAKTSCMLNGLPINKDDFIAADFFEQAGRFKRRREHFDCVFMDPPFFATTSKGIVDQVNASARLINKMRPLVKDGGHLAAINNALYVSGKEYMQTLESLCADGYMKIAELIPVPDDFAGYAQTRVSVPITDPAPFNHSTKIAVLEVIKRKER